MTTNDAASFARLCSRSRDLAGDLSKRGPRVDAVGGEARRVVALERFDQRLRVLRAGHQTPGAELVGKRLAHSALGRVAPAKLGELRRQMLTDQRAVARPCG